MACIFIALFQSLNSLKRFTTRVSIHPFTYIHILMAVCFFTKCQPVHKVLINSFIHQWNSREQFWVEYLNLSLHSLCVPHTKSPCPTSPPISTTHPSLTATPACSDNMETGTDGRHNVEEELVGKEENNVLVIWRWFRFRV